jgi:hypothetical protein
MIIRMVRCQCISLSVRKRIRCHYVIIAMFFFDRWQQIKIMLHVSLSTGIYNNLFLFFNAGIHSKDGNLCITCQIRVISLS